MSSTPESHEGHLQSRVRMAANIALVMASISFVFGVDTTSSPYNALMPFYGFALLGLIAASQWGSTTVFALALGVLGVGSGKLEERVHTHLGVGLSAPLLDGLELLLRYAGQIGQRCAQVRTRLHLGHADLAAHAREDGHHCAAMASACAQRACACSGGSAAGLRRQRASSARAGRRSSARSRASTSSI